MQVVKLRLLQADLDNGTSDNCFVASIAIDSSNFDCSEVGVNTVNFKAIDASGNRDSVNVLVTVIDSLKPLISHTTNYGLFRNKRIGNNHR